MAFRFILLTKPMHDLPSDRERFQFGNNWSRFLSTIDEEAIRRAEQSLVAPLDVEDLSDKSFLDLGSGSGLFSLAACRLGARVCSVDIDQQCIACARELKQKFAPDDAQWQIQEGSALDQKFLRGLGHFDVVYSWGVLHHTGQMWDALENAVLLVAHGGQFYVAIYNDQGLTSRRWERIKRMYNRCPQWLRFSILVPAFIRIWGPTTIRDLMHAKPFHTWRNYRSERGMKAWRDVVDWVGGYPFEVAKPEQVFRFGYQRGLRLTYLTTCGAGRGCNEFVFDRPDLS